MGSFSWTRAEHTTKRSNLTEGDSYKILIPKEFGGGYIKDTYWDYGWTELDDVRAIRAHDDWYILDLPAARYIGNKR